MGPPATHGRSCPELSMFDSTPYLKSFDTLANATNGAVRPDMLTNAFRIKNALLEFSLDWMQWYLKAEGRPDTTYPGLNQAPGFAGCFGAPSTYGVGTAHRTSMRVHAACNGRGTCEFGTCVCHGGAFGIDCAEGSPPLDWPQPEGLSIYVYELPHEFAVIPFARRRDHAEITPRPHRREMLREMHRR